MRVERRSKPRFSLRDPLVVDCVACGFGLPKSVHHIRGHEYHALIVGPPAPAAIVVLEAVEPFESGLHFVVQNFTINRRFQMQFIHGLRHDQVGQEARHGLLRAAPRITREVIERVKDGARDRRRNCDRQSPRVHVGSIRIVVRPLVLPRAGEDLARARSPLLHAERQNRQRHFECVRFLIGQRLGRERCVARHACLHAPVHIALALGGNGHLLRLPADNIYSAHVERESYVLRRRQIVMRNHAHHRLVALAEEARRSQSDNQVLAHQHARHRSAGFAVVRHGAYRRAPRGQRIGEVELHLRMAVGASAHIGVPIRRVGKRFSDLRHHKVRARFHLRHARMVETGQSGQHGALGPRFAFEIKLERGLRIEIHLALGVKRSHDVACGIGPHRVECLVHHAEAQIGLHRFARGVHCLHVKAGFVSRFVLGFRRRCGNRQRALCQRNLQALLRRHDLVVVNDDRGDHEIRLRLLRNRHIESKACARRVQHALRLHAVALGRYHCPRLVEAGHEQQVRGVAHLVGLFIRYDLRLRVFLVVRARAVPYPHPRLALHRAFLRRLGAGRDLEISASAQRQIYQHCSIGAGGCIFAGRGRLAALMIRRVPRQHRGNVDLRLHGLRIVVLRRHLYARRLSVFDHVAGRLHAHAERSIGGQHRGVAAHLAVRRVGYARLNAVVLVAVLAVDRRRQRHRELAIRVQHALVLLLLGLAIAVIGVALIVGIGRRVTLAVFVRFVFIPPIMLRGVHHVNHLGARNRLAEEIPRLNRGLDGVTLEHARRRGFHRHLVLGLLVLLNVETAAALARVLIVVRIGLPFEVDAVITQRRIGCKIEVRRDRSVRRNR